MKYYFAPLEGITNYRYRKIHNKYFNGIDKYFIPFLSPNKNGITKKDKKEIDIKNNNLSVKVVPQIISKSIEDTCYLIRKLEDLGYDEINLNFGCPSPTVTTKFKGGGILRDLDLLDKYLEGVFSYASCKISIKCRIGFENEEEFFNLIKIFNKYPVCELIIHPRTVKDFYKGHLHLDFFKSINNLTNIPIIYNGEIKSKDDIDYIKDSFPFIDGIMIGRGLISSPDLLDSNSNNLEKIKSFYYELREVNIEEFGLNNSLSYEKELWALMFEYIRVDEKLKKKLFKCKKDEEMSEIIDEIFNNCHLVLNLRGLVK